MTSNPPHWGEASSINPKTAQTIALYHHHGFKGLCLLRFGDEMSPNGLKLGPNAMSEAGRLEPTVLILSLMNGQINDGLHD